MFTALMYHQDASLRPTPSPHARAIQRHYDLELLFSSLLDFPVPSFANLEFEAHRYFNDDVATNLVAVGSFASFSLKTDFGRIFPCSTFFRLHSMIAQLPGNTPLSRALHTFAQLEIARFRLDANTTAVIRPAQLFGLQHDDTAYINWLNGRLSAVINQAEIRSMASRPNAGRIPMFPLPTEDVANVNPYLHGLSVSDDNIEVLISWLRNLASFIQDTLPQSRPLRAFTQIGNAEILRSLTFEAPPPTWHTANITAVDYDEHSSPFRPNHEPSNQREFAAALRFRSESGLPEPTADMPRALTARRPTADPAAWFASSVMATPPPRYADPHPLRRLNEDGRLGLTPRAVILEPTSGPDATAHHVAVLTAGKIIEINEITALPILTPHPRRNLGIQNTHYLTGAIPLSKIKGILAENRPLIENVTDEDLLLQPLGFIRGFYQRLRVPWFRQGVVISADNTLITNGSSIFAGAVAQQHATHADRTANVILGPSSGTLAVPDDSISLWSSYRHYSHENRTWYHLPSLRPFFGTRARTFLTEHPSRRIPA
jgi:hypothetical protein